MNEDLLARNAVLDGVRFTFPHRGYDLSQQRYEGIVEALAEASKWSDQQVRDTIKFQRIKSGRAGSIELDAYFIGGKLARFIVPAGLDRYGFNVTEMQVKFYLVEAFEGAHNVFTDACYAATGRYAGKFYTPSDAPRNKRASGSKGVSFGNQKADLHVTVNKYRGERSGVEGHFRGQQLNRAKSDSKRRQEDTGRRPSAEQTFAEVQHQAARRTARRLLRAARSRGIVLTDYFKGVSNISWQRPLHHDEFDILDPEEERQGVAFDGVPGFYTRLDGQASFLDEE